MSQNFKAKQPIFGYDAPKISQKTTPTSSVTIGGRSAAISSMIKKSDFDLMSLEKNPFGNYRNMLPNNPVSRDSPQNIDGNLMGKVEELVMKKLSEYKDIIGIDLKKNVNPSTISEEDKKDLKFLKENFKIQQSNTDQIISHINQFTQALNEINLLMSSHSEILNKLNGNSPEKNDGKQKNSLDDISYNQLESKVKSIELQMTETRNMIKKINESLLFDIKDNFKKNLSKIEFDQESLKNNLREVRKEFETVQLGIFDEIKETKIMVMENKKKLGDQNMDINKLSSHLKSELLNLSKKTLNESDSKYSLDPKWSEKLLKMESEMEIINKRTQIYEKKMDDFFFFKHTEELKEINNKFEELRFELIKINEKIFAKTLDSPENKRDSSSIISPLNSPQNNDMAIIDDKRYNSLIEKTKNNIDLAMRNSPLKFERLEKIENHVYESPFKNDKLEFTNFSADNILKKERDNIEDWYSKFQKERSSLENEISPKFEIKNEDQSKINNKEDTLQQKEKIDLGMKRYNFSDEQTDSKTSSLKISEEEKNLDHSKQLKNSMDDYGIQYLKETSDNSPKTIMEELKSIPLNNTKFEEEQLKPEKIENEQFLTINKDEREKNESPTPGHDEIVYHLDEEGFLMDENGNYIVDENEDMIKLTDEHIDYLRKSNMIEDDRKKSG